MFDHFLKYIIENKWKYLSEGSNWNLHAILELRSDKTHQANCFDLSEAFAWLCRTIGIKDSGTFVYMHQAGKKLGIKFPGLSAPLICFDSDAHREFTDGQFIFDKHCVAKVSDRFYDLTFSCHYDSVDATIDDSINGKVVSLLDAKDAKAAIELLEHHKEFDLNTTFQGWTLLHRAASMNLAPVVAYLIARNANPNIKDKSDLAQVPLEYITDINSDLFKILAEKTDPLIVAKFIRQHNNLLFIEAITAIENNDIKALKGLFNRGLEIIRQDESGWTLLHWAVFHKREEIVRFLLKNKADANLKDKESRAPIDYCSDTQSNIFKLLFINTDTHIRTRAIQTMQASQMIDAISAIENNDVKELDNLLLKGLSINQKGEAGWTLLHWSSYYEKTSITKWLIQHRADPKIRNDDGQLPSDMVPPGS